MLLYMYVHKDIELNIDAIIDSYGRKYPRRMLLICSSIIRMRMRMVLYYWNKIFWYTLHGGSGVALI